MPYFFKPNITDAEYKQEQVQFVSDNSGSNYTLLFCMFLTHVYLNYTHHLLHHYFPLLHKHFLIYLFSDLLISIPLVLFVLMYSSVTYYLFIIITIVGFVICYHYPQRNVPQTFPAVSVGFVEIRSLVNLWTLLAILAIDFTIYPREHTKSEFYGISLMDIGVGFVVMTSGIASGLKENTTPYLKNLKANCLQSLPIFAIGIITFNWNNSC
ncbi:GPI-anchored wall transfer protein 1 [Entamoeba marina]